MKRFLSASGYYYELDDSYDESDEEEVRAHLRRVAEQPPLKLDDSTEVRHLPAHTHTRPLLPPVTEPNTGARGKTLILSSLCPLCFFPFPPSLSLFGTEIGLHLAVWPDDQEPP